MISDDLMIFNDCECVFMKMTEIHNLRTGEISFSPKFEFDGIYMEQEDVGCCDCNCRHIDHPPGVCGWKMYTIDNYPDLIWIDCFIKDKRVLIECSNDLARIFHEIWLKQRKKYNE